MVHNKNFKEDEMKRSLPRIGMLVVILGILAVAAFASGQGEPTGPVTVTYWTSYPLL